MCSGTELADARPGEWLPVTMRWQLPPDSRSANTQPRGRRRGSELSTGRWIRQRGPRTSGPGAPGTGVLLSVRLQPLLGNSCLGLILRYFSPPAIRFLGFVLCFLVWEVLSVGCLLGLGRLLWIRRRVIPGGGSDAQSLVTCSVLNTQWLMGQGLDPRFLNLCLTPCRPHHTTCYLYWWRRK